ncbi:MAG TPA: hypothetical protein VNK89_05295 [Thermoflexus sp.]|nr:hypothetical protein [Thermoflexus sp.]
MRRLLFYLGLALLVAVSLLSSKFYPVLASGLKTFSYPPDHPGAPEGTVWGIADGRVVPLAPGTTVQVEAEHFLYPPDSYGPPEGTVWGTAGGRVAPLAPGVSIPLEEPQELKIWPEADVPLPGTTILLNVPLGIVGRINVLGFSKMGAEGQRLFCVFTGQRGIV